MSVVVMMVMTSEKFKLDLRELASSHLFNSNVLSLFTSIILL